MSEQKFSIQTGIPAEEIKPIERSKYMRHKLVLEGDEISVDLEKELRVDESDLVKCMAGHTGIYSYWAAVGGLGKRLLREKKKELEAVCAKLDMEARKALQSQDIKITENGVKNWVESDPRYHVANEDIIHLEDMVEFTDSVLHALEHRREMLREINRAQCNEFYQK